MGGPIDGDYDVFSKERIAQNDKLREETLSDEVISDATRKELLALLPERDKNNPKGFFGENFDDFVGNPGNQDKAQSILDDARAGIKSKFKVRQIAQAGADLTADRPGLLQTRGGRR